MKILCYGDSNTWGYIPNINGYSKNAIMRQYAQSECWWSTLLKDHEVIVDGLCGRCIAHENRWLENRNAMSTFLSDIENYGELDLIIFQLGTNDCKNEYNDSAEQITQNLEKLICQVPKSTAILLISPPRIIENNQITQKYYVGGNKKSSQLNYLYSNLASKNNLYFVSGTDLEIGEDGEHLTKIGHACLGKRIFEKVSEISTNLELNN